MSDYSPYLPECSCVDCSSKTPWMGRFVVLHGETRVSLNVYLSQMQPTDVFAANYTHNCNRMAAAAGLYEAVWRPDEQGYTHAHQLIAPLEAGIAVLEADPEKFRAMDPENKWGSYDTFLPWLKRYLEACVRYPDAEVRVSR